MTKSAENDNSGLEKVVLELVETVSAQSNEIRTLCKMVEQLRQELQEVTKTPTRKKPANQLDEPLIIIESAKSESSADHVPTATEVREARECRRFSVKEAAERIGVTPAAWYDWENEKLNRRPSRAHSKLIKLLKDGVL